MSIKNVIYLVKSRFFWINLAIAIVVVIAIGLAVLFGLRHTTHHGEAIEVPSLIGAYEPEADNMLQGVGLSYEVIDSVYLRDKKKGEIVEQTPRAGTHVKSGRVVYLTINAMSSKKVALPNLRNVSVRQAQYTLKSLGFTLGQVRTEPSEFPDLVLDILDASGRSLQSGDKLNDGATIVLVVGETAGEDGSVISVPQLTGLTAADAETSIRNYHLSVGAVEYDTPPSSEADKARYMVYDQSPASGAASSVGKRVDIYLSKDKNKARKTQPKNDDFF